LITRHENKELERLRNLSIDELAQEAKL